MILKHKKLLFNIACISVILLSLVLSFTVSTPVLATQTPTLMENITATGAGSNSSAIYGSHYISQHFLTTSAHTVSSIYLRLDKVGSPTGYIAVELKNADANGLPTGVAIETLLLACSSITTTYKSYEFGFSNVALNNASNYCIVVSASAADVSNYIQWETIPNLITNPSFESGTTGWSGTSATLASETTIVKVGSKSLKATSTANYARAECNVSGYASYAGKTVTIGGWVYSLATNTHIQCLLVGDGISGGVSSTVPKDSAWHWETATYTINAVPTGLYGWGCSSWDGTATTDVAYFDGMVLLEASTIPTYKTAYSSDSGTSWANDVMANYYQFQIWGNAALSILSANAFTGYKETGDLLITVEYSNTYPPYYQSAVSPKSYFNMQFMDLTGTTVLAAATMPSWGNKIGSVYLSASSASSITVGGAYYVKIYGTFTGNPYTTYQLTASDWKGTNMNYLDDWVITTAYDLQTRNSATYIIPSTGLDYLNDTGSQIYEAGIPMLGSIRPNLFFYRVANSITGSTETANNAYDTVSWVDMVGMTVAGEAIAIGGLFGISGQTFSGLFILMVVVIAAVIAMFSGGDFTGGFLIGWLLLIVGMCVRVIGVQPVIIGSIVLFGYGMIKWWVWRT